MIKLYDYWRSSACYRLRIGLNLKGIAYETEEVNLHPDVRAHDTPAFQAINPQKRVPTLEIDGEIHTQSMAILDWMDRAYPDPPFLPEAPMDRLRAKAFADTIACDIHPVNNVSILKYLSEEFGADKPAIDAWYATWIVRGFDALEAHAQKSETRFLFGDAPGLAEICLVPQYYNAERFSVDLSGHPKLTEIVETCRQIEAFKAAAPEAVEPA